MDEMYELLKTKLKIMREEHDDSICFDYYEVAQLYQVVCFMKQIRDIANGWDRAKEMRRDG